MLGTTPEEYGRIIRDFLRAPHERRSFDAFYRLSYDHMKATLLTLRRQRRRLPLEEFASEDPLLDLTLEVLGYWLSPDEKGRPFHEVFSSFSKPGPNADADELGKLYVRFRQVIWRKTENYVSKVRARTDPQLHNAKRRLKDELRTDKYCVFEPDDIPGEFVSLTEEKDSLDYGKPLIPFEELLELTRSAYEQGRPRSKWFLAIIKGLKTRGEYANFLPKSQLIQAVATVTLQVTDGSYIQTAVLPEAGHGLLIRAIQRAREEALEWLRQKVLPKWVRKGAISADTAERFARAAEQYLIDYAHSPEVGKRPDYFREFMPESEHGCYQTKYKHCFEAAMNKTQSRFEEILRDLL